MLVFSTPFSHNYHHIVETIKTYLPILHQDPVLHKILSPGVKFVAKRCKSLARILSPTVPYAPLRDTWLTIKGCYRCNNTRCSLCQFVLQSKTFTSFATGQTFPIKKYIKLQLYAHYLCYQLQCMPFIVYRLYHEKNENLH